MATLTKGSFELNLGIVKLGTELSDLDRQCAWELYTELCSRVAVTGKSSDSECKDFEGELYVESLDSIYKFFQEARFLMRKFPVGKIKHNNKNHLGILINRILEKVLRPFLEKWHVKYRHWWENESNKELVPMDRQMAFPDLEELISDWSAVRQLMREVQKVLVEEYSLIDVGGHE